jgi:LemA protein
VILFFVALIVFVIFIFSSVYNSLIRLKNQVDRSWANIDVLLKQRYDEIPQLVQVIEQYVGYENKILSKLMEARKSYSTSQSVKEKMNSSEGMSLAFNGLLALGENYPDLKSNDNFKQLQNRVSDLESQLSDRRETYNDAATNFNTRIEQIPDIIVARSLNYQAREMFKMEPLEKQKPKLKMKLPQ